MPGLDCAASRVTFCGPCRLRQAEAEAEAATALAVAIFYESGLRRSVCY